ncbi:RNA polymerase sigma-70 factor [uncultured Bacteroides sp.]|uniref:RNA polymerase sigma-70 factor n=1 Tax=uncultured Bacteroides sp. TaxID=162156 RepID=UPI002AAB4C7E|nr:RNA polymerase sigma-70 factor [uncultured Bacteroides sp.]
MKILLKENAQQALFQKLYEDYYAPFCLFAKRYIDDACIREDIVSDVFASLWNKRNELELKPETTIAYLKMCVRNNCLNYLKHQNYEIDYAAMCNKRAPLYATSPESVYTLEELYKLLNEALKKLPENYRTVFVKSFFEGKTHAEIAKEMNLSVKSIDRYKQKTIELLRCELKDYLPFFLLLLTYN